MTLTERPATARIYREISQLAIGLIDAAATTEVDTEQLSKLDTFLGRQATAGDMAAFAAAYAATTNTSATLVSRRRGPELALMHATVVHLLFAPSRPPLEWCPHRDGFDNGPLHVSTALRYAGCDTCAMAKAIATDDQLNADSSCDVCGQDNGSVRPRVTPFGAALVHFFTGRCCDELFDYGTPDTRTATFRRLARNEPCPCRSGRKFKHCCATVAAP